MGLYNKIIEKFFHKPEKQAVSPRFRQVYIELSTHCNLSCRSCIRQSIIDFKKTHFSPGLMQTLLPMLEAANLDRIVLLGFGEALCNPHIKEILTKLRGNDARIVLVSNASFLTDDMVSFLVSLPLDELYVSWDDDIYGDDTEIRRGANATIFRNNIETVVAKKVEYESTRPKIGLQIVATKSNFQFIPRSIEYGKSIGIERFIVSNLYPYSAAMAGEILYDYHPAKNFQLHKLFRHEIKRNRLTVANQDILVNRRCPFIEKGTLFYHRRR